MHSSRTDRLSFVVLIVALALSGLPASAQHWTVSTGNSSARVEESRSEGYSALPASLLSSLGGEIAFARGEARITIGDSRLIVRPGSPFYTVGGEVRQLVYPAYEQGGILFLPVQFFVEHLPALEPALVTASVAERSIGRVAVPARAAAPAPASAATPQPAAAPPTRQPAQPTARRLVVIDAGHGGVDPGARGPGGTREKDITLAVSRRLAAILREDPTMDVRLTRDRDTLIALTDRTRMANAWRADGQAAVFMSVHANASDRRAAAGFETFFLSEAKTEDARRVAEMENAAQRFESPDKQLDPLSFIMHDLRQNRYLRDSSDWAAMIQRRLATVQPGPNRGVKQAGFVVLNGAFMPAVLVEIGFISNPSEELLMTRTDHQRDLAQQLANAVRDFFEREE